MPSLRDTQIGFAQAMFADPAADWLATIQPGLFGAQRHLQVYRHNITASLTAALAAVYPAIRRLGGQGFFDYVADAFVREVPPRSGNLHDFGAEFADFLQRLPAAAGVPYLADVARLEWAYHRAYHAADAAALDVTALAAITPDEYAQLRFRLHPSAQLLASDYPLLRIWQINQPDYAGNDSVDLGEGADRLLVLRPALDVGIVRLTSAEFDFLSACAVGATLIDAAALVAAPDFDLTAVLQRHVALSTFASFASMSAATGASP